MRPLLTPPRSDAVNADDAVARLAAAVLRQAVRNGDDGFFVDWPMHRFWCHCAGLPVDAVRACYRRLRLRGPTMSHDRLRDDGRGHVPRGAADESRTRLRL